MYGVDERTVFAFEKTTMWGKEDQYLLTTEDVSPTSPLVPGCSNRLKLTVVVLLSRIRDPTSSLSRRTSRSLNLFRIVGRRLEGLTPMLFLILRRNIWWLLDFTRRRSRSSTRMIIELSIRVVRSLSLLLSMLSSSRLMYVLSRLSCSRSSSPSSPGAIVA